MIYLQMFWSFLKIGFTSFGGLSMIPLIKSEMVSHGWMTVREVTDIVAIAEMTPGPLGLNCATFAGIRMGGIPGAIAANLGVLAPSLTLAVSAAVLLDRFRGSRAVSRALTGVRPAVMGMVAGVIVSLSVGNYVAASGGPDGGSIAIGAVALLLLMKFDMSVPLVIGISAVLGLLLRFAGSLL